MRRAPIRIASVQGGTAVISFEGLKRIRGIHNGYDDNDGGTAVISFEGLKLSWNAKFPNVHGRAARLSFPLRG